MLTEGFLIMCTNLPFISLDFNFVTYDGHLPATQFVEDTMEFSQF